jgi:diguanylate cyclase (GGDEF)-like protein
VEPGKPGTATRVYHRIGVLNASILSDAVSSLAGVAREPALASELSDDVRSLVERAEERQRSGVAPDAVVAELLALGRIYDRRGRKEARERIDAAVEQYVGRVAGKLADRARRDSLTGVLNHASFQSRLADETARAKRYNGRLALAVFDLDRFKETNDRLGHQEGDRLLQEFARTLAVTVRVSDSVGRVGGDEFGAILLETEPKRLAAFLERLYERLPPDIAVSAGAAFLPADASTPERLIALADERLYTQKAARAA